MRGGYDLYGNYYPNENDAINAEMAQCNELDNRINSKRIKDLEQSSSQRQQYPSNEEDIHNLWEYIKQLEQRIDLLENK